MEQIVLENTLYLCKNSSYKLHAEWFVIEPGFCSESPVTERPTLLPAVVAGDNVEIWR